MYEVMRYWDRPEPDGDGDEPSGSSSRRVTATSASPAQPWRRRRLGAGLVDEVSLYVSPVSVGGGTPALPLGSRYDLRLHEERVVGDVIVLRSAVGRVRD